MALTAVVDFNGVAIAVGDTVKLTGTVLKVDPTSTHYKEVTIQLAHPVPGVPNPEVAGFAPAIHSNGETHHPGADQIIRCSGVTLTH
jgi:hypothetical protein